MTGFYVMWCFLRFIHVIPLTSSFFPFLWLNNILLVDIPSFVYPLIDGHLNFFTFFPIRNNTAMNICV